MPAFEENWQPVADTLGFRDVEQMLKELYLTMHFSISEIATVVGYSGFAVRKRLVTLGIPLRGRGGPNNRGRRKLAKLTDEQLSGPPPTVAIHHGVHISTVFAEKRLRRLQKEVANEVLSAGAGVLTEQAGETK